MLDGLSSLCWRSSSASGNWENVCHLFDDPYGVTRR